MGFPVLGLIKMSMIHFNWCNDETDGGINNKMDGQVIGVFHLELEILSNCSFMGTF